MGFHWEATGATRYNCCSDSHGSFTDAAEATLLGPHQARDTLPVQGNRDEARRLALQATWRPVERPEISRAQGTVAQRAQRTAWREIRALLRSAAHD